MRSFAAANARLGLALLALFILMGVYFGNHPRGLSLRVLTIWSNQGILLALAALAQFSVVLVKGIDLSVGSVVALTNVAASYWVLDDGLAALPWILLVLLVGVLCGLINGLLVVVGRLQPIVVTLATASVFGGLALLWRPVPGGKISERLSDLATYDFLGLPVSLLLGLFLSAALSLILRKTPYGLSLYAIGSSEGSARLTGVRVGLVKLCAYAQGGFFGAVTGLYVGMVTLSGDPGIAGAYTLHSVAAVVLGGVALTGGVGGPFNALVGALILKTIASLMFFSGVPPLAQPFFEGIILAGAIALGALGALRAKNRLKAFDL
ncbi:MAG: ABC transporter permease [Deltaproteobacteria bacterium]|nr:ABC transporter permease [Deltaproteobacteria bacterium]